MQRQRRYMQLARQRIAIKAILRNVFIGTVIIKNRYHLMVTNKDIIECRGTDGVVDQLIAFVAQELKDNNGRCFLGL